MKLAACLLAVLLSGCGPDEPAGPTARIALVVTDESAESRELERGARAAAELLDVELAWRGAFGETGDSSTALRVRQAASEGFDALVVAADGEELAETLAVVEARGVPYALVGDDVVGASPVARVHHDPYEDGRLAAAEVARAVGGRGTVAVLRAPRDDAAAAARTTGFTDALAERDGVTVAFDVSIGASVSEAQRGVGDVMHRIRDVDALFAPTSAAAHGALLALGDAGDYGEKVLVGFGATTHLLDAVVARGVTAVVVDDPERLGDAAVRALVGHLRGHPVARDHPVPSLVVTPDNHARVVTRLLER